ncbi:hypothetical protein GCM10025734_15350 [Kitasatospora paranensis]|uniref:hypothetical protein n=1 Tax=Kitasatospora paranensis TaxID=258053 RepID=UPI0031E59D33
MNGASTDLRRCRELGREAGLAAGLAAVLNGFDPASVAPGGVALLPAAAVSGSGAEVLPHPFAAREGLALVRFPAGRTGAAGTGTGLTGVRAAALTAVRTGCSTACWTRRWSGSAPGASADSR